MNKIIKKNKNFLIFFKGSYLHCILMRNLAPYPKNFIYKSFDLKGSTYEREVLNKNPNASLNEVALKDLDFINIEEKVLIPEKLKNKLLDNLKKDVEFFKSKRLIDYSFLIILGKRDEAIQEMKKSDSKNYFQIQNKKTQNDFISVKSLKNDGIYYHFGIIDYLQNYNVRKIVENYGKRLIKFDAKLDISVQDPNYYGDRFLKFMEKIFK